VIHFENVREFYSVANGIIEEALEHDCDGIIFEKLDGIRDRYPSADWHSKWAFCKLKRFGKYKTVSMDTDTDTDTANPKNTSKRCTKCGSIRDNSRHRDEFGCQRCSKQSHADSNSNSISRLRPAGGKVTP
jgi:transposase